MSPAFKEWLVICGALGTGEQILVLRKGGIAEDRDRFRVQHDRFWLYPTLFHQQMEKTKSTAQKFFLPPSDTNHIMLQYWAEVAGSRFIEDWQQIEKLDAFHFWKEETVRERFNWGETPGLFAIILRVHRLRTPLTVEITAEMGGCKSWVDLPFDFLAQPATPVLNDDAFAAQSKRIDL